ncbi:MAG: hypothetical protein QNJ60_02940 [Xenococcaceae cyanobacterium MO_188.B19]|nr:hypothetical protein [Xenococcaceae cyanobacterium MO_188.B19]
MKQSTLLMLIVSIVSLGQLTLVDSAQAKPDNITTDSVNSPIVNTGNIGRTLDGTFNPGTESFIFNDLSGGFGLSEDVINALSDPNSNIATGSTRRNSNTDNEGSAVLGSDDSFEITICSSDPCTPKGDTEAAITLNDLAKLIEEDLNQSFNELLAAEQLERELADQPRRVIKRRSSNSCNCTACVNPAIEARREFEEKLENYQEFVTEMDRFKPENDAW